MAETSVDIPEAERIAGEGDLGVRLLVDIEQIGAVSIRSQPGSITPPLHLHERHVECLFVLDGQLTLTLEDRELQVHAGTWAFIPQEVVHTFAVSGESPAHFLDVHTPSCDFGEFVRRLEAARSEDELRQLRAAFDQRPAPEYATGDPGLVVLRRVGGNEGETLPDRPETRRATILLETDEIIVSEFFYGPGERGAEPHVHHHHADAFLVVEGELTVTLGTGPVSAPAGTLVVLPPNVVHGFNNDGTENMLVYNVHVPASGFGDYLRGRNPGFDQHDPPADGAADSAKAIITRFPV